MVLNNEMMTRLCSAAVIASPCSYYHNLGAWQPADNCNDCSILRSCDHYLQPSLPAFAKAIGKPAGGQQSCDITQDSKLTTAIAAIAMSNQHGHVLYNITQPWNCWFQISSLSKDYPYTHIGDIARETLQHISSNWLQGHQMNSEQRGDSSKGLHGLQLSLHSHQLKAATTTKKKQTALSAFVYFSLFKFHSSKDFLDCFAMYMRTQPRASVS